jgi:hypothetical protein
MAASILSRVRRNRARRGAAATEGLIIATFFVFIFACMWGALTFHHEKIRVMRTARAQAWLYALNACEGGGGSTTDGGGSVMGDLASNSSNSGASSPPDTQNDYANIGDSQLSEDSGYAWVQVNGSVTMPGLIGGSSYVPEGKMYMRCNEEKPPDNLLDIAKRAIGILAGIFGF